MRYRMNTIVVTICEVISNEKDKWNEFYENIIIHDKFYV